MKKETKHLQDRCVVLLKLIEAKHKTFHHENVVENFLFKVYFISRL